MRRTVDGHFTSVTASDDANQLLGYMAVDVHAPAAVAVLQIGTAVVQDDGVSDAVVVLEHDLLTTE
jgi:hypothetical protein